MAGSQQKDDNMEKVTEQEGKGDLIFGVYRGVIIPPEFTYNNRENNFGVDWVFIIRLSIGKF